MTEREGFDASNARALNGFLVLGPSFRSVSTRHSCTFYWGFPRHEIPIDGAGYLRGLSGWVALVFADWPGQTRTASWLKAENPPMVAKSAFDIAPPNKTNPDCGGQPGF